MTKEKHPEKKVKKSAEFNKTKRKKKIVKLKNTKKDILKEENLNNVEETEETEETEENEGEVNENIKSKKKEISKRQLKKEKAELRAAEAKEASRQAIAQKALNYVSKWKHIRSEWKFEKLKQIWLSDNLLSDKYISNENFTLILEYFEGCKGLARKQLIDKAMKVIKNVEDKIEDDEECTETVEYKRARQLLQSLPGEI